MSRTCLAHAVVSPLLSLGSTRFPLSRLCSCVSRFLHISSSSASSRTSRPASCFAELSCGWLAGCAAVVCGVWRCCGSSMRHVPVGQPTLSHCDTHLFIYIYIYVCVCLRVGTSVYVRACACAASSALRKANAAKDYGAMQQAIASLPNVAMIHSTKAPDLSAADAPHVTQFRRVAKDLLDDWEDVMRLLDTANDADFLNVVGP